MGLLLHTIGMLAFAHAGNLPVAVVAEQARCYATVDQAAIEALKVAMALRSDVEHGGAIYDRGGCFVFSAPVTNDKPSLVQFRIRTSTTSRLAGIYHTHTASSGCDHFSGVDVLQARYARVPSFIGVHGPGHIRKLAGERLPPGPLTDGDRAVLRAAAERGVLLMQLRSPVPLES